jgi:hypothetical protein
MPRPSASWLHCRPDARATLVRRRGPLLALARVPPLRTAQATLSAAPSAAISARSARCSLSARPTLRPLHAGPPFGSYAGRLVAWSGHLLLRFAEPEREPVQTVRQPRDGACVGKPSLQETVEVLPAMERSDGDSSPLGFVCRRGAGWRIACSQIAMIRGSISAGCWSEPRGRLHPSPWLAFMLTCAHESGASS